jgi:chitodextrinase
MKDLHHRPARGLTGIGTLLIGLLLAAAGRADGGLVAAYSFDKGTGTTVADASGNGNNGTINGATWTSAGHSGNGLVFDGTSALVTINDSASLHLTTGMTLEAWVYPTTVSAAWRDVVMKGNDNYYLEVTSKPSGAPASGGDMIGGPLIGPAALTTVTVGSSPSATLVTSNLNPSGAFWVRADAANVPTIAHVDFWVDGALYHRENVAPYCLFGDDDVNPLTGTLPSGAHTIVAEVYSDETTLVVTSPSITVTVGSSPSATLVASSLNPSGAFWVRADVANVPTIAHVDFWVDGALYHREGIAPYCLFGDDGVNPLTGTLPSGAHTIVAKVYSDETTLVVTSPSIANTWTHLATTYDGATLRLYVNGVEVASRAQAGSMATSTDPLQIGGDGIYGQYFQGMIDEVRVYNVALTAAQIQSDMNTPIGIGSVDTQPATVPNGVMTSADSSAQVTIRWNASSDSGGSVAGYRVYRNGTLVATTQSTSYSDNGLNPSAQYCYTVVAFDSAGNSSSVSAQACATTPTSPSGAPVAPSNLTATAVSTKSVGLRWQDNSTNELGFQVERAPTASGPWVVVGTSGANVTQYLDLGLSPATDYYYRVSAFN